MKNFIISSLNNSKIKNLSNDEYLISLLDDILTIKFKIYLAEYDYEVLKYQEILINNYYKLLLHLTFSPECSFEKGHKDIFFTLNKFFSETVGLDKTIFNFDINYQSIFLFQEKINVESYKDVLYSRNSLKLDEVFNKDLVVYITGFNNYEPIREEYFHLVVFLPFFINGILLLKPFKISYPIFFFDAFNLFVKQKDSTNPVEANCFIFDETLVYKDFNLKSHQEEIINYSLSDLKNLNNLFYGSPNTLCETICNLCHYSSYEKLPKIKAMVFVIKDYKTFIKKINMIIRPNNSKITSINEPMYKLSEIDSKFRKTLKAFSYFPNIKTKIYNSPFIFYGKNLDFFTWKNIHGKRKK